MIRIVNVTGVEAIHGYVLRVSFSDGTSGVHDFSGILSETGPMVEPLKDHDLFRRVFISLGVLTWPNGFDLDSIQLQREMREAGELRAPTSADAKLLNVITTPVPHSEQRRAGFSGKSFSETKSSRAAKMAAASALTQSKSKEVTSAKAATAASKILGDPKVRKPEKAAAASALTQRKK